MSKKLTGLILHRPSRFKDLVDFQLSRVPTVYRWAERRRRWLNWDRRVYLSCVRRGDIACDVGANFGGHAVLLSHIVRKEGKVIALEPVPPTFAVLQETVRERARYDNVILVNAAVGNPETEGDRVSIAVPGDDLSQASLARQNAGSWVGADNVPSWEVPLTSVDATMTALESGAIDFLKIDVEGGELNVLRGARETLKSMPLVYCEIFRAWTSGFGYTPLEVFEFMATAGYEEARIIHGAEVISASVRGPISENLFDESCNVLFFAGKHATRIRTFDSQFGSATTRFV